MLDGWMRQRIDPPLNRWGRALADRGWSADAMTGLGLALGLAAAAVLALGGPGWLALLPLLAGRVADGLDGAIARVLGKTDFGGFADILADFAFYGAVPLAFALRDPANAVAAAFLLFTYYVNGASFLAYATIAAKRGMQTRAQGEKSLYFSAGLLEGTETILFLTVLCLWPLSFQPLAWGFGALCLVTAGSRAGLAARQFR
jgi:phosphatidylglycerophosphate synthase